MLLARNIAQIINENAYNLDSNLAEALNSSFEKLPEILGAGFVENFEPPNPIQQMLAQVIQKKLNPDIVVKEINKGPDGLFTGDTSS